MNITNDQSLTKAVALAQYTSPKNILEKISGLEWELNPPHISGGMLYQRTAKPLGSKVVGRKVLVLGAHALH